MRARAWGGLTGKMSGGGLHSAAWASVITLIELSVITLPIALRAGGLARMYLVVIFHQIKP